MNTLKKESTSKNYDTFMSRKWDYICDEVYRSANMSQEEIKIFNESKTAKLIAYIAYAADCPDEDRVMLSQLSLYVTANRSRTIFDHGNETMANRLKLLCFFPGGDAKIKRAGKILLLLVQLYDHARDYDDDKINKQNNPLFYQLNFKKECDRLWGIYNSFDDETKSKFDYITPFIPFMWWLS